MVGGFILGVIELKIKDEDRQSTLDMKKRVDTGEEYVTLFFSFDIVNSTQYKTIALKDSQQIIKNIFDKLEKLISGNIKHAKYWRTIGDEIIFYLQTSKKDDIKEAVDTIFSILNEMKKQISNCDIKLENSDLENYRYPDLISIKGTCWLALVGDTNNSLNRKYNTGFMLNDNRLEFQGHDIDVGFRVAKYTRKRRLALNFELAYILSEYKSCENKLHFIGYEVLKGVWNSRKYPIIWYHSNELKKLEQVSYEETNDNIIDNFENSFFYDEEDYCELTKNYNSNIDKFKNIKMRVLLKQICSNLNLTKKIEKIYSELNGKSIPGNDYIEGIKKEIHLVVICYNEEKNTIVCFKRKKDDKWDFGCITIDLENNDSDLEEKLKEEYLEKFKIIVEVKKIYRTYYIKKDFKKVVGLRFIGAIKDLPKEFSNPKYTEYCEVSLENYKDFQYIDQLEFEDIIFEILGNKHEVD